MREGSDYRMDAPAPWFIPAGREVSADRRLRHHPAGNSPRVVSAARRRTDELFVIWSAARAEANLALEAWRARPGRDGYLVYRAAEDRADAAEQALWELARPLSRTA